VFLNDCGSERLIHGKNTIEKSAAKFFMDVGLGEVSTEEKHRY